MRVVWAGVILLACMVGASAGEPAGKLVREYWDSAFLDGQKAGYFHTTVTESKRGDQTIQKVTRELRLTVKRFGDVAQVRATTGDEETPDGKLVGVFMTMDLARDQQVRMSGTVSDGVLDFSIDDPNHQQVRRKIPLPPDLITYLAEESFLKDKQAKPGDRLTYRLFDPTVNNVIRVQVEVKGYEQVPLDGVNRKLLRVVTKPEKIQNVQLPPNTFWYDEEYRLVMSEGELPLGSLTLRRTSKEKALASNGKLHDIGDQSVVLNRAIPDVHGRKKITFRVTFTKENEDAGQIFSTGDNRQSVKEVTPKGLVLTVGAIRTPPAVDGNALVPKNFLNEYLESNYFINSDDEKVQELAKKAVGKLVAPWEQAKAIEKWVKANMHGVAFTEAMATSDHVARTLSGDCTEFAMLTAAMCRAVGVPSRTAIGMVYADRKLPFHMWTEVFIHGQWVGLDATMGQGSIGPGHVKITDHSWHDVRSFTPLLPVMRFMMAKPKMEVLKVE